MDIVKEGIRQLGYATRRPVAALPPNGLELDTNFLKQYIYDVFVPGMFVGSRAIGVKLTTTAIFMVAPTHKIGCAFPVAFPILQKVFIKDILTGQSDRPKTMVTQALEMTPTDFLEFCAFGASTVAVVRNIPQFNSPTYGGITDADGLETCSAAAACLLATENMLNPGTSDPMDSGMCVLVSTAYIPYGRDEHGEKTMAESFLSIRSRPPRHSKPDPIDLLLRQQQQTFQINATAGPLVLLYNGLTLELLNQAGIAYSCFHTTDSLVAARPRRHVATAASMQVTIVTGLVYPLRMTDFLTTFAQDTTNASLLPSIGCCFPLRPPLLQE